MAKWKPKLELKRQLSDGLFKAFEFTQAVEDRNVQRRRGYIWGGHAYDAGINPDSLPDCILTEAEEEGWWMGWQSRYAAEMAELEPSQHGVLDGKVPDSWFDEPSS
jgi:hypothetical protein